MQARNVFGSPRRTREMKRKLTLVALMALLAILTASSARSTTPVSEVLGDEPRAVDVVICLDTSGSMEDLIDAARARVWDVIGELARMQPTPELRVGLLTFRHSGRRSGHGMDRPARRSDR